MTEKPSDALDVDPRCAKCGHKRSEHHYRHPFVGPSTDQTIEALATEVARLTDDLDALQSRLQGMTTVKDIHQTKRHEQFERAESAEAERDALLAQVKAADEITLSVAASLAAAISLLENGGKKAAPSDKMFKQMLQDYRKSLDDYRAARFGTKEPTHEQP